MSETTDKNPLIQTKPSDTLEHCADVLDYLAWFNQSEGVIPTDDIRQGGFLISMVVTEALRWESERVKSIR